MKNLNIPIYRAKKIDSDEYVEGYYEHIKGARGYKNDVIKYNIKSGRTILNCNSSIDPTTLAIHLTGMLDSKGNKIFASLSDDGRGGDLVQHSGEVALTCCYKNGQFWFCTFGKESYQNHATSWAQYLFDMHYFCRFNRVDRLRDYKKNKAKVTGIQK